MFTPYYCRMQQNNSQSVVFCPMHWLENWWTLPFSHRVHSFYPLKCSSLSIVLCLSLCLGSHVFCRVLCVLCFLCRVSFLLSCVVCYVSCVLCIASGVLCLCVLCLASCVLCLASCVLRLLSVCMCLVSSV